jgi:hypothetical protein
MRAARCHVETFGSRVRVLLNRDFGFTYVAPVKSKYPESADFVELLVTMSRVRCKIPRLSITWRGLLTRGDAEYDAKTCEIMRLSSTQ